MKEIDFLPARYRAARQRRRQSRRNVVIAVGMAGALGLLHLANAARIRTAEATVATLLEGEEERQIQAARLESLRLRKDYLQRQAALVNQLDDDIPPDVVIAEVSRLLAPSMAIRSLELHTEAPPKTAGKETDRVLVRGVSWVTLSGMAVNDMDVGIFYGKLSSSPLFSQVEMKYCRQEVVGRHQLRAFEVTFRLRAVELHG